MRDDYEGLFAEVIDKGIREGHFVDIPPKLATKPFFGALNWATVWFSQRHLQSPEAIDEIAHTLAAFAIRGLIKDSSHAAARTTALFRDDLG
jgi:Tetracyclin repressor-like, C-terminal domain